jgi:hypothetical protein
MQEPVPVQADLLGLLPGERFLLPRDGGLGLLPFPGIA